MSTFMYPKKRDMELKDIIKKYRNRIQLYFLGKGLSLEESEEYTNDTFLKFYQHYNNKFGIGAISLLYTIAKNIAIDQSRKNKKKFNDSFVRYDKMYDKKGFGFYIESSYDTIEELIINEEEYVRVKEIIYSLLTDKIAPLFMDYFIEDYKLQELCVKYDLKINAVKSRIFRGLKMMKEKYEVGDYLPK